MGKRPIRGSWVGIGRFGGETGIDILLTFIGASPFRHGRVNPGEPNKDGGLCVAAVEQQAIRDIGIDK